MINRRIARLERQDARQKASAPDNISWQLSVTASCPPDKTVRIRQGVATPAIRWANLLYLDMIPETVCDFENEEDTQMDLSFANAGYYLPLILCYFGDWVAYRIYPDIYGHPVFDNVIGTEVETAAEAEAQIDGFLNGVGQWYDYRLPLCGIVLKNDGAVDIRYAILPVDQINRGRSYLYRDARVRRGALP